MAQLITNICHTLFRICYMTENCSIAEVMSWDGKAGNVGDIRLFRAKFWCQPPWPQLRLSLDKLLYSHGALSSLRWHQLYLSSGAILDSVLNQEQRASFSWPKSLLTPGCANIAIYLPWVDMFLGRRTHGYPAFLECISFPYVVYEICQCQSYETVLMWHLQILIITKIGTHHSVVLGDWYLFLVLLLCAINLVAWPSPHWG